MYVCIFLCCSYDKLEQDSITTAQDVKRENIIEKIEEVQFYFKKLKTIYEKKIFYEGHERFIQMLYHFESERNGIDLSEKRHNLYIEGDIARDRKYDLAEIEQRAKNPSLDVDLKHGGTGLKMKKIKSKFAELNSDDSEADNEKRHFSPFENMAKRIMPIQTMKDSHRIQHLSSKDIMPAGEDAGFGSSADITRASDRAKHKEASINVFSQLGLGHEPNTLNLEAQADKTYGDGSLEASMSAGLL